MPKSPLNDIIIVVPGIMGSVLVRGDEEVWAPSLRAVWRLLRDLDLSFEALALDGDDPQRDVLDDGIRSTDLMPDAHLLPGFWKIDGYTWLTRQIKANFQVTEGRLDDGRPANYFEFHYDWRRDNRLAACRLKRLIEQQLPRWQETHNREARVILVSHSMGGLIARYYLDVLGGAESCRALYTFGTPLKGAINALNYLANGYSKLFSGLLRDVLRSFTAIYQLVPIYPTVMAEGGFCRPTELPPTGGLDACRMRGGADFLRELLGAADRNGRDRPYLYHPLVGRQQPTLQSLALSGGRLVTSSSPPPGIPDGFETGDGTVPEVSAIPDDGTTGSFIGERHASLQNHPVLVDTMITQIKSLQAGRALSALRGVTTTSEASVQPVIALHLEDLYHTDENVEVRASVTHDSGGVLTAILERADSEVPVQVRRFEAGDTIHFSDVSPGLYRIRVQPAALGGRLQPVHDLFQVVC